MYWTKFCSDIYPTLLSKATYNGSHTHSQTNCGVDHAGRQPLVRSSQDEASRSGTPPHSARRSRGSNWQTSGYNSTRSTSWAMPSQFCPVLFCATKQPSHEPNSLPQPVFKAHNESLITQTQPPLSHTSQVSWIDATQHRNQKHITGSNAEIESFPKGRCFQTHVGANGRTTKDMSSPRSDWEEPEKWTCIRFDSPDRSYTMLFLSAGMSNIQLVRTLIVRTYNFQ